MAEAYFDKDPAVRLWGAKHGGVYVPVSEDSPPNPYLTHVPEQDITTLSGQQLTLINPACMIRQMTAEFSKLTGVVDNLTSLNLLITDVIMPGMNGKELAAKVRKIRSSIPILFMSGYTDNIIARQVIPGEGVLFVQKPVGYARSWTIIRPRPDIFFLCSRRVNIS